VKRVSLSIQNSFHQMRSRHSIILIIALVLGAVLRLVFFVGPTRVDPFWYLQAAGEIVRGTYAPTLLRMHWLRYALILPTSLGISLAGVQSWSVVAFPFLCSLGSILLIYLIGQKLWDTLSGLAAAGILTALSWLDLTLATQLLPGSIVAFFLLLVVYLTLIANEGSLWRFLAGGLGVGITYSARFATPALILPVILGIGIWKEWQKHQWISLLLGMMIVPSIEGLYFLSTIGDPFHRLNLLQSLQSQIGLGGWVSAPTGFLQLMFWDKRFATFFYGFLVSGFLLLYLRDWCVWLPVGWWFSTYALLEVGYSLSRVAEKDTRMIVYLVAPAALVMGRFLGRQLQRLRYAVSWLGAGIIAGFGMALMAHYLTIDLSWKVQGFLLSSLMLTMFLVSIGKQGVKVGSIGTVLFFLLLGTQAGAHARAYQEKFQNTHRPYKEASAYLASLRADEVLTNSDHFANVFHYYRGLDQGYTVREEDRHLFHWRWISSKPIPLTSSSVYLVSVGPLHIPHAFLKLEKLAQFQTDRGDLTLYRSPVPRSPETAEAYGRRAWFRSLIGDTESAREDLSIAQTLCRSSGCEVDIEMYLRSLLARVEYQDGQEEAAIAVLNDLMHRLPETSPGFRREFESSIPFSIYETYYRQSLFKGMSVDHTVKNGGFEQGLVAWQWPAEEKDSVDFNATQQCAYRGELGGQIRGLDSTYHNGFSAPMSEVVPGSYIVVGAMVKAYNSVGSNPTDFKVEVNYVQGHNQHGDPVGMHGKWVRGSFSWTPVVRIVKLPADAEKQFSYYPALLTGKGTVCIDDAFAFRLGVRE